MRNIFIIVLVLVALGYMGVLMVDKYNNIKETNAQIAKNK